MSKTFSIVIVVLGILGLTFFILRDRDTQTIENPFENIDSVKREDNQIDLLPYLHPDNSFSFQFPKEMTFSNISQETQAGLADTVIFSGQDANHGFQIYITPFDSGDSFTIMAIRNANPNLQIRDDQVIAIADTPAIVFLSKDAGSNFETREIWFVRENSLYQISTYPEFDAQMVEILSSWIWY